MRVSIIAQTTVHYDAMEGAGYRPHLSAETFADELAEFAGRYCYQSWDRPNPATATNSGYLANIVAQQHFSVLEHASVTFLVEDVSRSLTHELVRHRHLSFSQVSQRYVPAERMGYVIPPALADGSEDGDTAALGDEFADVMDLYTSLVEYLQTERNLRHKQAREAARCVLPNMTATGLVVSGNLRAWREVVAKRDNPAADAEIQALAREILAHLKIVAPHTFRDMT